MGEEVHAVPRAVWELNCAAAQRQRTIAQRYLFG